MSRSLFLLFYSFYTCVTLITIGVTRRSPDQSLAPSCAKVSLSRTMNPSLLHFPPRASIPRLGKCGRLCQDVKTDAESVRSTWGSKPRYDHSQIRGPSSQPSTILSSVTIGPVKGSPALLTQIPGRPDAKKPFNLRVSVKSRSEKNRVAGEGCFSFVLFITKTPLWEIWFPVWCLVCEGNVKIQFNSVQFNFIYIASITIQIVSRSFPETQIMTPEQISLT